MEPCREGFPELELCETKGKKGVNKKGGQRLNYRAAQQENAQFLLYFFTIAGKSA